MKTFDVAIIGAGPAGMTAALYAARKGLSCVLFGGRITGGQAALSGEVGNYLGFSLIRGSELVEKFREHVEQYNEITLREGIRVTEISRQPDGTFTLVSSDGERVQTAAVILSMGEKERLLHVPGEKEFRGKGVTYCATCDGPLFRGKDVAVVGGGNSGLTAALELASTVKSVVLVQSGPALTGDRVYIEKISGTHTIRVLCDATVRRIVGETFVKSLEVQVKDAVQQIPVAGVFIEIGWVPATSLVKDLVALNEKNEIVVDADNKTNVPGIFACGDITNVHSKQIVIAAGEGAKAALSCAQYLLQRKA